MHETTTGTTSRLIQRRVTSQFEFGLPSPPWMAYTFAKKTEMKPELIIAASILIGSVLVSLSSRKEMPEVKVDANVIQNRNWGDGDYSPSRLFKEIVVHSGGTVIRMSAGEGEYANYRGFYPMPTISGLLKVNMVRSGEAMNDHAIDHIYISGPVEFKSEQGSAGQPATSFESGSEGEDKPQPESEGRSQ
jgi:hypothetical protein